MDRTIDAPTDKELEKPPTLVAESAEEKASGDTGQSARMSTAGDDKSAKMPVLKPNVSVEGTRSKSGRMHKPAKNFSSDEYVVPTLVKRRIPNNSRAHLYTRPPSETPTSTASDVDMIRSRLEEKFSLATSNLEESPFQFIIGVCFKEFDGIQNISVADIHCRVKDIYKNWTKGPYKLREDEIKFVQECIIKPEWSRIPMKEWRILAEALKDRHFRMRKRFSKSGRFSKAKKRKDVKKCSVNLGLRIDKNSQDGNSDEEMGSDEDVEDMMTLEDDIGDADNSSHSSRLSIRSKDPMLTRGLGNSKTPSLTNEESKDEFDLSMSSVGMDDITSEDLKDEMFDDLESAIVNESKNSKVGHSNSMVAALHATLQKDGGPQFDPSQYEPPALEKDSNIFALDDMEVDNSCNFFENMEEPSFGNAETPAALTDEAFAELEQRVIDEKPDLLEDHEQLLENDQQPGSSAAYRRALRERYKIGKGFIGDQDDEKLDLSAVEIEESSGNVKVTSNSELGSPGVTMISTKTALMCALKISEDFLPSSHEKYLERLEETDKYRYEELVDIRKKFGMKPSTVKRKLSLNTEPKMKPKLALKVLNGTEKPKAIPYLRSAYAKCRKFMEDETTVIEKLGNNKILAGGRVIDIDYENYLKESAVDIPYDDAASQMPSLPPPSASNCHAPSCRLGCICSSISEDMPPRTHCGRPKCFFECNCQQILFNNNDDGDIRSRLRPRVSLLNWRAESTEKEKEPMTSYRQMERGSHFIRLRRPAAQPERLRREFVLDGKVVERNPTKVNKERLTRTKALLQSSHRRIMAKPDGHRFMRMVPGKPDQKKPKSCLDKLVKQCTPLSVDVEHLDVDISVVEPEENLKGRPKQGRFAVPRRVSPPKMSAKDVEEMKSIIQEMTEDCQLMVIDEQIGFFSWAKGGVNPKVVMYQVMQGDVFRVPWLYLPIPPQGYSWICHHITSSFEKSDYVYIPEIKCCISSEALRVNMNLAFVRKKTVVFDVKAAGNPSGIGKIYFLPDLPKVLVCGPFKTDQTTMNPRDLGNADKIAGALQHLEKLKPTNIGDNHSWKRFTSAPTIYPIRQRNDNETVLSPEDSRALFEQLYPSIIEGASPDDTKGQLVGPAVSLDWSNVVKIVGVGNQFPNRENLTLTELISMNL